MVMQRIQDKQENKAIIIWRQRLNENELKLNVDYCNGSAYRSNPCESRMNTCLEDIGQWCWHQQQRQELRYAYLLRHRSRCIIDLKFTGSQFTKRVYEAPCSLTIRLRPSHRIGSSLLTFTISEDWISDRRPHINYRPR